MDSLRNRIMKEYNDLTKSEAENNIVVWMVDNNIRHWKGKIKGPVKSHLFRLTQSMKAESSQSTLL